MTQNDAYTDGDSPAGDAESEAMSPLERRAAVSLAGIFSLRMLGLFMILPVFSLHAKEYAGYTPLLSGIAIGIYGLTQAMFQIPFGMLSDHIGRKKVIVAGLAIFVAGSIVAALADTIWEVIGGRALQGFGAIAAAVLALTADLTREEQRTKAMAIIGVSIGLAFALAMVIGPAVTSTAIGLPGLFWLTAILSLGGIAVLLFYVPDPVITRFHRDTEPVPAQFARILGNPQLLRLDVGILILHLIMTATFVTLPLALRDAAGVDPSRHWMVYLGVLTLSVILMAPFVMYADRKNRLKHVFVGAVAALVVAETGLFRYQTGLMELVLLMVLYFTAFNILEASLPSLVSRLAPSDMKGTALGAYSTAQYLGAFLGGAAGGWLHGRFGTDASFALCAALGVVWLAVAVGMRNPPPLSSFLMRLGSLDQGAAERAAARLLEVEGVAEAVVVAEDGVAYLKVDRRRLDRAALRAISTASA
ncbi:MAG: MFS transporter [Gammaproteobacteria bacterium]|nr:MFS transporter [Gammaproteobacteria bacterium]